MFASLWGLHLSSLNRPPASRNESNVEQELYFMHGQPRGQRLAPDKEEEEDKEKEETMQGFED